MMLSLSMCQVLKGCSRIELSFSADLHRSVFFFKEPFLRTLLKLDLNFMNSWSDIGPKFSLHDSFC